MLKIFIGYDHRQPVSYTVLSQSIIENSSMPVSITPIKLDTLPMKRAGLTPFTYSRFLTPYLSDFKGWSLFLDIDMMFNEDVANLFKLADDRYDVLCVKNKKRFEWASLMLFNNEKCQKLTPDFVEKSNGLHQLLWCEESKIGELPSEWNHLVGYDEERQDAKLVHFTQGVPAYPETMESEYSDQWHKYLNNAHSTLPWDDLMAKSVHSVQVNNIPVPKFLFDEEKQIPKPQYESLVKKLVIEKGGAYNGDTGTDQNHNSR